jgi:tRNA dimethylallyltransferase
MRPPFLLILVGPTAVGKSALALALAEEVGGEIMAVDSMQVYRRLNIGTAKPTPEERARVPHHLIDLVEPDEDFNAALYRKQALNVLENILARKKIPIICGGTGLYLRAFLDGIFEGPGAQRDFRKIIYQDWEEGKGLLWYEKLKKLDPEAARRLKPQDKSRIVRALEVYEVTGLTISQLRKKTAPLSYPFFIFALERSRPDLYRRIDLRVEAMIKQGLLDEVKELLSSGLNPQLKSLQGLGYKHMIKYLMSEWSWEEAVYYQKRDTRRYAKRQLTWFRKESRIQWIFCQDYEEATDKIQHVKNLLANRGILL